jgi:hypothetical protein
LQIARDFGRVDAGIKIGQVPFGNLPVLDLAVAALLPVAGLRDGLPARDVADFALMTLSNWEVIRKWREIRRKPQAAVQTGQAALRPRRAAGSTFS